MNLSAKVTVTLEVDMGCPYGPEWQIGEILKKTHESAKDKVNRIIENTPGVRVSGVPHIQVISIDSK